MSIRDNLDISAYLVIGPENTCGRPVKQVVASALAGGFTCVQVRSKVASARELIAYTREAAEAIAEAGKSDEVALLVDDRLDVVLAARAQGIKVDGVHVGQSDLACARARALLGPDKIIGASAHNVEEAVAAQAAGADYLGAGAAFVTSTKGDARPIPHAMYRAITDAVDIPVVAIGGITEENMAELRGCGLDGVAVVSSLFAAQDVAAAAGRLRALAETL